MVRKSKQEAMKTRQDILKAAITVFLRKGVAKATVHEIADEANLTRGAVYWHFDDKDDLVTAVFEEAINVVISVTESVVDNDDTDSLSKLKTFLCGPTRQLFASQDAKNIITVLMHFCDHGDEAANAYRLMYRAEGFYEQQLKHLLKAAIDDGHLRSDLDVDTTIFWLISTVHGLVYRWLTPGNPIRFDLEHNLDSIVDSLFIGIQNPKSTVTSINAGGTVSISQS